MPAIGDGQVPGHVVAQHTQIDPAVAVPEQRLLPALLVFLRVGFPVLERLFQ